MAALGLIAVSACGGIGIGAPSLGASSTEATPDGGAIEAGNGASSPEASTLDANKYPTADSATPAVYLHSPLCKIPNTRTGTCDPDEAACRYNVYEAGTGEGGSGSGSEGLCESGKACSPASGVPTVETACRVGPGSSAPVCDGFNPNNLQGAACSQPSDCAVGYECVAGDGGQSGTCKHYCCDPHTCESGAFCDIEPTLTGQLVPVCDTSKSCSPLSTQCPATDQTCTIVNAENGQTACVSVGPGKVGDECVDQKCGADLACVGNTCRQLCNPHSVCPAGQSCTQPSAYSALGDVGLCSG